MTGGFFQTKSFDLVWFRIPGQNTQTGLHVRVDKTIVRTSSNRFFFFREPIPFRIEVGMGRSADIKILYVQSSILVSGRMVRQTSAGDVILKMTFLE